MKILQCGCQRSGNYLMWRILRKCQKILGVYSSFSARSGIGDLTKKVYNTLGLKPHFSEVFELDRIEWKEGKIYFHKQLREDGKLSSFINVDLDFVLSVSSLIWSHTPPALLYGDGILDRFDKLFYILRDGRAVVNSLIHHVVREESILCQPTYNYFTAEEVYKDLSLFKKYVLQWKIHVESFLEVKDKFVLVRFEDLIQKKGKALLLSVCGLNKMEESFIEEFSFSNMKREAPSHLRKGDNADWRNFFREEHKDIFKEVAGDLL